MQLVYPWKCGQMLLVALCAFTLLRPRDFCSEKAVEEYARELTAALPSGGNCSLTVVQMLDFYTIEATEANETVARRRRDQSDHDETVLLAEEKEEENGTTTAAGREEEQKTAWKQMDQWHRSCLSMTWGDVLFSRSNLTRQLRPSWPALLLLVLIIALELELFYLVRSQLELNIRGAVFLGLVHVGLVASAAVLLVLHRFDWSTRWPQDLFEKTPHYPDGWFRVEIVLWLLALGYVLEVFYHRVMKAHVVFVAAKEDTYHVAERENHGRRTYVSAYTEPLDGSQEI